MAEKMTLVKKIQAHLRALEAGKAGYKRADELLDQIEAEMTAKRIEGISLTPDEKAVLVDQLKEANAIPYGGKARRYKIKVVRAADVTAKL